MQLHAVAVLRAQLSALSTIEGLMIDITVTCSPNFGVVHSFLFVYFWICTIA